MNEIKGLFPLGLLMATPGALAALAGAGQNPLVFIARHVTGDWGDLPPEDVAENQRSLMVGSRLFSAYTLADGTRMWIITEHDRSATTMLLPAEY